MLRIISPLPYAYTSTDGSDRFNFFRPSSNLGLSFISSVETLTFRMGLVWDETGTKEIQSSEVEIVPDLKICESSPDIPITHPADASSMPSGY